jgi:hypothetical protein
MCGWTALWLGSIDIAINKAYTARAFDLSTADLGEQAQPGRIARHSGRETEGAAFGLVMLRPNGALPDVGRGSTLVRLLPYTKRGNHARRAVVRHVIGNARGTPCLIVGAASSTKEGS